MIASLRRRHRRGMLALAIALPLFYGLALASRPAPAIEASYHAELADAQAVLDFVPSEPSAQPSAESSVVLTVGALATGEPALRVDAREAPTLPEAQVYWTPGPAPVDDLSQGSQRLGPLPDHSVRVFPLPAAAIGAGGRVVVWSVAWRRSVAELALP